MIGAATKEQAVTLAKSVVSSILTKAAIYGHDANWGRIPLRHGLFRRGVRSGKGGSVL